jgi:hypothetical protein
VCIQERLPAGAAGVLVIRYDASTDLILSIDAQEKTMFDGIDGHRSIATIVDGVGDRLLPRARGLFQKLLWNDSVVLASSKARCPDVWRSPGKPWFSLRAAPQLQVPPVARPQLEPHQGMARLRAHFCGARGVLVSIVDTTVGVDYFSGRPRPLGSERR